jgi:hypothetical protein
MVVSLAFDFVTIVLALYRGPELRMALMPKVRNMCNMLPVRFAAAGLASAERWAREWAIDRSVQSTGSLSYSYVTFDLDSLACISIK